MPAINMKKIKRHSRGVVYSWAGINWVWLKKPKVLKGGVKVPERIS